MLGYTLVKEEQLEQLRYERGQLAARLDEARATTRQAEWRAAATEAIAKLQATSIAQLMASNERMVKLVADMRRVGFGILEPVETNDTPETTDQYDREAVQRDPALAQDLD